MKLREKGFLHQHKTLRLKETPDDDIADLVGLICRSHGRSIRSCIEYLKRYDIRDYQGIHAIFLMALVRISDYLQIHADRAPEQILRIRTRSPVSHGDGKLMGITTFDHTHMNPEPYLSMRPPRT